LHLLVVTVNFQIVLSIIEKPTTWAGVCV
jgi:hypothetical protein